MKVTITKQEGAWTFGQVGNYSFQIKHTAEPSTFGIDEGRIIKLWLASKTTYTCIASFERGWDKLPSYTEAQEAAQLLIDAFN